jgi:hypothetical protein
LGDGCDDVGVGLGGGSDHQVRLVFAETLCKSSERA